MKYSEFSKLERLYVQRVWDWNKEETAVRYWYLIVPREVGSADTIKYSLSNAPEGTTPMPLSFMQGQRYFVERSFLDAKGTTGMDHYPIRSWLSWHRHTASMLFIEQAWNPDSLPY